MLLVLINTKRTKKKINTSIDSARFQSTGVNTSTSKTFVSERTFCIRSAWWFSFRFYWVEIKHRNCIPLSTTVTKITLELILHTDFDADTIGIGNSISWTSANYGPEWRGIDNTAFLWRTAWISAGARIHTLSIDTSQETSTIGINFAFPLRFAWCFDIY